MPMKGHHTIKALFLLIVLLSGVTIGGGDQHATNEHETCEATGNQDDAAAKAARHRAMTMARQPPCRLYLAESTVPDAGLGVFSAFDMPRGLPIGPPDIIIQMPDPIPANAEGLSLMLTDYVWDGQETGGQYEGIKVFSIIPGMGMLANGHIHLYNALPFRPSVDEADVARTKSPGAGSFTHYHNHSFYSQRPISAGGEIFINYGLNWFREREEKKKIPPIADDITDTANNHVRSPEWLARHGMCLDNIRAGRSTNKQAGRGAFATRFIPKDGIIAPAPVVQITNRDALRTARVRASPRKGEPDIVEKGWQLLRNYVLGHEKSSIVLFPYGNTVNLINHSEKANAVLRWSNWTQHRGRDWPETMSIEELKATEKSGLMLEFVAMRDIMPGEEVLINYGDNWQKAWDDHVANWKPVPGASSYTPSYIMDDVAKVVRTEEEQRNFPYGDNIITSCFYRYSDNADDNAGAEESSSSGDRVETTAVKWEMKRGIFDLANLRPCSILKRDQTSDGKHHFYTVLIRNRYGLRKEERIPKGAMHVVNMVPRHAIRFSDKIYTTDHHLPNVFRHEIELPDGVFPEAWMDLKDDNEETLAS